MISDFTALPDNMKMKDGLTVANQKVVIYEYMYPTSKETISIIKDTYEPVASVIQQAYQGSKKVYSLRICTVHLLLLSG